jgi:hypothetical protein
MSTSITSTTDAAVAWLRTTLDDAEITGDDNFLDVGGHSMIAINFNAWLTEEFGVTTDLAQLFQKTIREAVASAHAA